MQLLVKHIMTAPVVSLFADQSLPLAEEVMRFRHVHHLPVIDETHRLVGMVSDRDILGAQISSATDSGNWDLLLLSTIVMAALVVAVNRSLWRPLYRLAQTRYKLEG